MSILSAALLDVLSSVDCAVDAVDEIDSVIKVAIQANKDRDIAAVAAQYLRVVRAVQSAVRARDDIDAAIMAMKSVSAESRFVPLALPNKWIAEGAVELAVRARRSIDYAVMRAVDWKLDYAD